MKCTYTALFLCSDIKHFTIYCCINTNIHTLMVGAAKQGTNPPIRSNLGISIMRTEASGNQTADLPISERPVLPPEPQLNS